MNKLLIVSLLALSIAALSGFGDGGTFIRTLQE